MVCINCILRQNLRTKWSELFLLCSLNPMICENGNSECSYFIIAATLIFIETQGLTYGWKFWLLTEENFYSVLLRTKRYPDILIPLKSVHFTKGVLTATRDSVKTWKGIMISKGRQLWLWRGMRVTSSCSTSPKPALCPMTHEKGLFFHCSCCAFGIPYARPKCSCRCHPNTP